MRIGSRGYVREVTVAPARPQHNNRRRGNCGPESREMTFVRSADSLASVDISYGAKPASPVIRVLSQLRLGCLEKNPSPIQWCYGSLGLYQHILVSMWSCDE